MFGLGEGKRRAFEEVALSPLATVYNVALRLTGNRADAEDLAQETFLKAYRAFDQFQRGTNCKAWLLTILRNTYRDQWRRKAREPEPLNSEEIGLIPETGNPLEREDLDFEVEEALRGLSPDQRMAVLLCDVEGMSYEEIANVLDCPIGTVRSG